MNTPFEIRPAMPADAPDLAKLVVIAGEGMPLIVWDGMRTPGESVWDVGARRAAGTEGAFSYRNADVALSDGAICAAVVSYALPADAMPDDPGAAPPLFRPLVALENRVRGTWYVNVLASYPSARRRGAGTALVSAAAARAHAAGYDRLSLITADVNPARRLYSRLGFAELDRAPIVKDGWDHPGRDWVLMAQPAA
ncbi:MAG: GNAT family N-acetyltransferase [Pseudomonadota bacterium]